MTRMFKNNNNCRKAAAFTLTELIIVVALIIILATLTLPLTLDFLYRHTLIEETEVLESNLKSAQTKAISAENNSSFGVKFFPEGDPVICPETACYVVFQGSSYNTREPEEDEVFYLSKEVLVEIVSDYSEVVFEKNTGLPEFK